MITSATIKSRSARSTTTTFTPLPLWVEERSEARPAVSSPAHALVAELLDQLEFRRLRKLRDSALYLG